MNPVEKATRVANLTAKITEVAALPGGDTTAAREWIKRVRSNGKAEAHITLTSCRFKMHGIEVFCGGGPVAALKQWADIANSEITTLTKGWK